MADLEGLFAVTVDCPDPSALARFYQAVAGGELEYGGDGFVALTGAGGVRIDFQRVPNAAPPVWPDLTAPRRVHLDFRVGDLAEGEERVVRLGAAPAEVQPGGGRFRVFLDPAGHPFCLVDDA